MRRFVFADEAGCFAFNRGPRSSKYFIACTIALDDCGLGKDLLDLRRTLAWEGYPLGDYFHACEDKQVVRDKVFELLGNHKFSIQATILEKSKAQPQVRRTRVRFYQYAWFYHFKFAAPSIAKGAKELSITTASIGTKGERGAFKSAVNDVLGQSIKVPWRDHYFPAGTDPCLQAVDYCTWAIQRRWERDDDRSYKLIKDRITHEYNTWQRGASHYY